LERKGKFRDKKVHIELLAYLRKEYFSSSEAPAVYIVRLGVLYCGQTHFPELHFPGLLVVGHRGQGDGQLAARKKYIKYSSICKHQ